MKKHILVIHGGTTFEDQDSFLSWIEGLDVKLDNLKLSNDWKANLQEDLGDDYEVLNPKMPNKQNADYKEWKTWFEKIIPLLSEEVVLIGHSLGGLFLAKYLSENNFSKKIESLILVAAVFDADYGESLVSFSFSKSLEGVSNQSGNIYLIHSKDDPVVPIEQLDKYKESLPNAKKLIFEDRQHFNQEHFPEIIDFIKNN